MPNNSSIADHVTDFQRLLQSVAQNGGNDMPDVSQPQGSLQDTLIEMTAILSRQDAHRAGLRADSKRLRELMVRGADYARQIRSLIRGYLGPRNEKLVEFRIPVLGRPRALPSTTPPPPLPEAPAPDEVKS
ncbi:MAG TPA: hypothetical protein VF179_20660 [Thermoanaerobaculia bacterium]|nr:hypothetical protein [Thermoanaerobaculia bacterium]